MLFAEEGGSFGILGSYVLMFDARERINLDNAQELDFQAVRTALASGTMTRRDAFKRAMALGLSLSAAVALLSEATLSGASAQGTPGAAPSGTLVIANAEPPTSAQWDSYTVFGLVDAQVASLVHDSLLGYDNADGTIVGHLATAWEMTEPTKMTLTLREGVTFHDGTPVTANDVKAAIVQRRRSRWWHGLARTHFPESHRQRGR